MRHAIVVPLIVALLVVSAASGQDAGQPPPSQDRRFSLGLVESQVFRLRVVTSPKPAERPHHGAVLALLGAELLDLPPSPPQPKLRIARTQQQPWRDLALGLGVLGLAALTNSPFWLPDWVESNQPWESAAPIRRP